MFVCHSSVLHTYGACACQILIVSDFLKQVKNVKDVYMYILLYTKLKINNYVFYFNDSVSVTTKTRGFQKFLSATG